MGGRRDSMDSLPATCLSFIKSRSNGKDVVVDKRGRGTTGESCPKLPAILFRPLQNRRRGAACENE